MVPYVFTYVISNFSVSYCMVQNGGGRKLWLTGRFKNLVGKTLANCSELSLSSLIKSRCPHAMLKLKTTIAYFTITCGFKLVHAFAVSSVMRGHHKYKDVWNAPIDGA